MTSTAAPPAIRPVSATVWAVAAALWALPAIGFGAVRLHQEWSEYQMWRDFLDETSGSAAWGMSFASGWAEITLLGFAAGVVWIGLSLAWLGVAVTRFGGGPRPRGAGAQLVAVGLVIAVGSVATAVLVHDSYALPSLPPEARLMTPAFVCAAVLVLDGVVALLVARWPLRDETPVSCARSLKPNVA
jgi:hypothetical protein